MRSDLCRESEDKVRELFELGQDPAADKWAEVQKEEELIAELKSGRYGDPVPVLEAYLADSDEYLSMRALDFLFIVDLE